MTQLAIQAEGLGKRYRLGEAGYATLREQLARGLRGRSADGGDRHVWALRDLDLQVPEGDVVGIVGRNGAGKTTFLKSVARIVRPTTGLVRVRGRVGALLEVGTGFHPELTGRENVFLNGVVLGMSRREVRRRFDDIVEFAGVERFLDTPLKRYSSGMHLRLAFGVAAHIDPDVLIVDEVLAVGDAEFQQRCLGRMSEFGREGRTVLFVSHDTGTVGRLCRRAIWLEGGRVRDDGPAADVLERYHRTLVSGSSRVEVPFGEHDALRRLSLAVLDDRGAIVDAPRRDEALTFELALELRRPARAVDVAVYVTDRTGLRVVNENLTNSRPPLSGEPGEYRVSMRLPPILASGDYVVGAWVGNDDELLFRGELFRLSVLPLPDDLDNRVGVVRPPVVWDAARNGGA